MMDTAPITEGELVRVIGKSRPSSAPSPFDSIPYIVFKQCPSLHRALLDLFHWIMMEGEVLSSWKRAALKLFPKGSAQDNPASPSNFRPIELTPTVSKLLSGILRDRWLRYMRDNNYLDPNIQIVFLPTVPGVSERQAKLAAIVKSAKWMKRSLAVACLDIANAYGSVHHTLIQFSMAHYHAPSELCRLLQS